MRMVGLAIAAGWKHNHTPGIRFFETQRAVDLAGAHGKVVQVGEFFVQWPANLGPTPTIEDLERWLTEYNATNHHQQSA